MIKERFKAAFNYLVFKGEVKNQRGLAKKMNTYPACVSNALKGDERYLTTRFVKRFCECFQGTFNENWILTGEGDMLANPSAQDRVIVTFGNNVTVNAETARSEDAQTGSPQFQLRPVVTKALSSKPNTDVYQVMKTDGAKMQQLVAFRQYADFDFYWQVRQDAMLPVYGQGDVLALVHLKPDTTIIQGAAMVVDTKDFGFLLRNIYDRGDYYECRCVNDDSKFETQNIKKDNVIRLYRVVYSVRLGD